LHARASTQTKADEFINTLYPISMYFIGKFLITSTHLKFTFHHRFLQGHKL